MIDATIRETAMTTSMVRKIPHADGGSDCNASHVVQLPFSGVSRLSLVGVKCGCNAASSPIRIPVIPASPAPATCHFFDIRSHAVAPKIANALHMLIE